jgi:hypothetical protein
LLGIKRVVGESTGNIRIVNETEPVIRIPVVSILSTLWALLYI